MSYMGFPYGSPYSSLPYDAQHAQYGPPVSKPLASKEQLKEYDRVKRKNNGLIIGLVVVILLLLIVIVAIFVLLYAPIVTPGTTPPPTANVLSLKMEVIHTKLTYDNTIYGNPLLNGFKNLVNGICDWQKPITEKEGLPIIDCKATKMSANTPTGIKVEDFTITVQLGTKSKNEAFILLPPKLVAGKPTDYVITDNSYQIVTTPPVSGTSRPSVFSLAFVTVMLMKVLL